VFLRLREVGVCLYRADGVIFPVELSVAVLDGRNMFPVSDLSLSLSLSLSLFLLSFFLSFFLSLFLSVILNPPGVLFPLVSVRPLVSRVHLPTLLFSVLFSLPLCCRRPHFTHTARHITHTHTHSAERERERERVGATQRDTAANPNESDRQLRSATTQNSSHRNHTFKIVCLRTVHSLCIRQQCARLFAALLPRHWLCCFCARPPHPRTDRAAAQSASAVSPPCNFLRTWLKCANSPLTKCWMRFVRCCPSN